MITSKQFVDSNHEADLQDKAESSDHRQIREKTPITQTHCFSKDIALGCFNSGINISGDHYSLIAANINNTRDDNYSEEDSMSCTNCTDYSEDDISSRELDQLPHISKFLAGMREQHRGTGPGSEDKQHKSIGSTVRASAVSATSSGRHYNRGRRGSSSSSGTLREISSTIKREYEDKNGSSRRRNSDLLCSGSRNTTHTKEKISKSMRNDFISIKESVDQSSLQRIDFETSKHLKESSSSHFQYIVQRMVKRSGSEEGVGQDMTKRITSRDIRRGTRAVSYDREDCLRRGCCSKDVSVNNVTEDITRNIAKEADKGSSIIRFLPI
jgi:hypothetical protein